ncbi:MAG: UDP-N-acetylglucosamine 1-carboxyvinyltransferase [Candidatus Pacebacteria bacterium]|nr:UDP-N-acetylglucosamine 1-carboxyvinyltransferase [Candidatus Paceibacterota bacterium]
MSTYIVTGGTPLSGSVRVGGAKNASYKIMIASLLGDSPSRLLNFSKISDVKLVADMISSLGANAKLMGERAYFVDPQNFSRFSLDSDYGRASRASTMFIPVLLHKFGQAVVPFPGGDKIGKRPLERHFDGLIALGATVEANGDLITVKAERLKGTHYKFKKNTHTGTETLIMAAVKAQGITTLENAAQETEVDDLIKFLNSMGGKIKRIKSRTIEIEGVDKLHGSIHKIMPDQNQVISFACAAIATKGDIIVENTQAKDLLSFLEKLDEIGGGYELGEYGIRFFYKKPLTATNLETAPHPGFKTDWQPLWTTLITQAKGESTVHETVSQSRFNYTDALIKMGAKIELFNPIVNNPKETYNFNPDDVSPNDKHAIKITGPSKLHGGEFEIKDLRHGATLLIAGMIAEGETILNDPENHIDRGYERLDELFETMGANIKRLD